MVVHCRVWMTCGWAAPARNDRWLASGSVCARLLWMVWMLWKIFLRRGSLWSLDSVSLVEKNAAEAVSAAFFHPIRWSVSRL